MISCSHWGCFRTPWPMSVDLSQPWWLWDFNPYEEIVMSVRDSRGTFTLEEWQKMPPEIPPPLKPWWKD